ncbi:hypothetical protein D1641_07225 [Colidextribacter sp. OB.20]|uniref:DUF5682 family protein n=1 Tax=Colidextribacter sp. OB.20 TaxID=2304568 RepID=UPI00136F995C|nr:DUF5682 family protein [Colidextribacter sp. OB.20]NBI09806.1 hypothetical protein [Colidextribacter sp. OB.20]
MSHPTFFGVRHLSPAAAHRLREALDAARPELVLVEGPSDLNGQMEWLCHPETKFPAAILAYTKTPPVRTVLWPFAVYSPETQAILWAYEHGVECRFMDLPSSVFLAFREAEEMSVGRDDPGAPQKKDSDAPVGADNIRPQDTTGSAGERADDIHPYTEDPAQTTESVYKRLETLTGEDHDTFWERNFEQAEDYQAAANAFGRELRAAEEDGPRDRAETVVREAYMKRVICQAVDAGISPEKIFCVCGAFHVAGLEENAPMTDGEEASLPRADTTATLMPYSYYRLSTRSGYGAGNRAPAYFELLWDSLNARGLEEVPYRYLTRLAAAHRKAGNLVSSAEVIEAVRLADTLAAMRGSRYPALADLRDASVTAMGHGQFSELALAAADTEIGKKIGFLPQGVARTSVQEDFYRQLKELRLEKFRTAELQRLDLDLREKLNVKSEAAALGDLRRSFFLHRLRVLGVHFAALLPSRQEGASWGEYWELRWTPEAEIEIVESALMGDTIQGAAAFALKEQADSSTSIGQAAAIFQDAFLCGMPSAARHALSVLQGLGVDAAAIADVADTASRLSLVVRYGDLRRFDPEPVIPLVKQLYLRACLTLAGACVCDVKAAPAVTKAMDQINALQLSHDFLEEDRWLSLLEEISDRDDLNTRCSGFAMAILLERGKADEELLAREVARRLSPGVPADLGAGWFEGLAGKNRYALIARLSLWRQLDGYLSTLDDETFRRALVFLRRAFAGFSPKEKNDIAENLGEIWGVTPQQAAEVLMNDTTEAEQEILNSLSDFDFDDI